MKRAWLAVSLFYGAVAIAVTFPLVMRLGTTLPHDLGDPLLSATILWWNAHVLPLSERWWNGFAFFPASGMLAFSDHRLGESLIASPLQWLGVGPIAAYNVVLIATFVLCGLGAHALAFTLTKRHDASLLCGLAYGFNPYRVSHLSHLELLAAFGMPAALAALHRFLNDRRPVWIAAFAFALWVQGLCASYYLLFFAVVLALWLSWFVRPSQWREAAAIVIGGATAAVALGPIAIGYWRIHQHYQFARSIDEIRSFSADVSSLVTASSTVSLWRWTSSLNPGAERQLFPGLTITVLAAVGLTLVVRRERAAWRLGRVASAVLLTLAVVYEAISLSLAWFGPWSVTLAGLRAGATDPFKPISVAFVALIVACAFQPWARSAWRERSPLAFYLAATGFLFLCSLGPKPTFLDAQVLYKPPYDWLMHLPLFASSVRAPARFAMPAILTLSAAGALALNQLNLSPSLRRVLVSVLMAGIVADGWIGNLPLPSAPDMWQAPAGYRFGAVLELPIAEGEQDFYAMYRTMFHGRPTVNGNSGYFPPGYFVLLQALKENDPSVISVVAPPTDPLLVVVDKRANAGNRWSGLIAAAPGATLVGSDALRMYFSVPPYKASPACLGATLGLAGATSNFEPIDVAVWKDGSPKTYWISKKPQHKGDRIVLDLGQEAHVCGLRMSIADSWHVYPRVLSVATSRNAADWSGAFEGSTAGLTIRGLLERPKDIWIDVPIAPQAPVRFIRLQLEASHDVPWFIPDLQVIGQQ
jgi:hypothetical protein